MSTNDSEASKGSIIRHHEGCPEGAQASAEPHSALGCAPAPLCNALTIDVEDYFQVSAFAAAAPPSSWPTFASRVERNTLQLLEILARHQVRGTFFVLGWVAERYPTLIREIQSAGHELGCHSYWHRLIYEMTPAEFREDLRLAKRAIEDAAGVAVRLFRAPSFSITKRSLWALDVLIGEGFEIDSSIFPVRHDRYGIPEAPRFPFAVARPAGTLWEFPPTVHRLCGCNVPIAGGGYFRLYPTWVSIRWLNQINRVERQPFVFYIHPWEIDPDQPRLPGPLLSRWRHTVNLRHTKQKLETLLRSFRFGTISDSLRSATLPADPARDSQTERLHRSTRATLPHVL